MAIGRFVAYYRVSTKRQGDSGLGLAAQKNAVADYLNGGRWDLLAEFTEIESGRRNDRPALAKALRMCRLRKAVLCIAKLDRLSRNAAFLMNLLESGVELVACDVQGVNKMTLQILAIVAENEAKAISDRTRVALQAAAQRGTVLGGRRVSAKEWTAIAESGRAASIQERKERAQRHAGEMLPIIQELQADGAVSLREIADRLNALGEVTRTGKAWTSVQVMRVLRRADTPA
jgi:DNA invertase Pin-like site-specific DNA recombinase